MVQPGLLEQTALFITFSSGPSKEALPSINSITWPLFFFDHEGSFVPVGRDEKAMFPKKERSPKPPNLMDGESLNICLVFSPPQAGQILDLSGL